MKMPAINIRRTYLIARRDYLGYVKTWGFWISFFLPFVIGAIVIAVNLAGFSVSPTRYEAILDETGVHASAIIQQEKDKQDQLVAEILIGLGETVLSEEKAETLADTIEANGIEAGKAYLDTQMPGATERMKALDSKLVFIDPPANDMDTLKAYMRGEKMAQYEGEDVRLNGVLHIYNDGEVKADYWSRNVTDNPVRGIARRYFEGVSIDSYLATGGLNRAGLEAAEDERITIEAFDPTKAETEDGEGQKVGQKDRIPYLVAFGLSMMLWMTVFSGAYMLLTSMLEEKMNKLLEMMLATTRFSEIILGKLLGVALLTLTAIAPYIIMGIVGVIGAIFMAPSDIAQGLITAFSPKMIIFFTVFLILGYIFYGSLFIALGALAESMQDAQTLTTPIMFVLMGAVFVVPIGLTTPDSPILIFASWFPLSSPFAMLMRLPADPPLWQLLASVGLLAATTLGVILLSGRIFRFGVLSGAGVKVATDWFKRKIFTPQGNIEDSLGKLCYKPLMMDASQKARADILAAMLPQAAFDGWTQKSLRAAVKATDLPEGAEELYFPEGPLEVIRFWSEQMNAKVAADLAALDQGSMKIRDKVTAGVLSALYAIGPHEEAARRAMSRMSLPDALGQGPKQLWSAADTIWRAIGDTSTDGNYYSKRTILAGVIASTLTVWLSDDEPQKPKARKFLDNRIAGVMRFEKAKWAFKEKTKNFPTPAEVLGVLRYGGRKGRRRRRG